MSAKTDKDMLETLALVRNVREWRKNHRSLVHPTEQEIQWHEAENNKRIQSRRNWDFNHGKLVSVADCWPK
jgi:hypothetical protein